VQPNSFEEYVGEECGPIRLDIYLADRIEDASRSFVKKIIQTGAVRLNGGICKRPSRPVMPGDRIAVDLPPPREIAPEPEPIPLDISYEDEHLIVVNKPSGMVVHPAPGHDRGTLVNALLHHCPELRNAGADPLRPGIVHRIDQYTSGLLIVAKSPKAYADLGRQVRAHSFDRRYLVLVQGEFEEKRGRIDATIGRSMVHRRRMAVTGVRGREAVTHFNVLERFRVASLLGVQLETGRTHQIRVHLRFAGHPVIGDPVYGVTDYVSWKLPEDVLTALRRLEGQALHAERLGFIHPATGERLTFVVPLPPDFQAVLDALRAVCK
jgi:23S rRNA pseudouridine1911/1915/1917 synthase